MREFMDEVSRFLSYYDLIFIGRAFLYTALLSLVGSCCGFVVGCGLAIVRIHRLVPFAPLRWLATAYVEIFRRIPFLVKLMLVLFTFQFMGVDVPMFVIAAITVALAASAFCAENIRAGLESIHVTQWEAAEALNMGGFSTLWRVVLPQAWRVIIPPSMTYSVGLVKSTAIASQLGVPELTYAAKVLNQRGFSVVLCFGTILVLYFILCWPLTLLAAYLEKRLAPPGHR